MSAVPSVGPQGGRAASHGAPVPHDAAPDRAPLDAALCAAHLRGDGGALVGLYTRAADAAADADAASFYLTHAYVFALEAGDPRARALHARLCALGREQ